MLQGGYTAVMHSRSRDEFRDEVSRFARRLEFEYFSAMLVVDHAIGRSQFITVDNTPTGYKDTFRDTTEWQLDPVMQHCKRQSVPIIWNQETYTAQNRGSFWEEQARFGYRTGIAMALHMPDGRHFMLGMDRDSALPSDPTELTRVVAELQLFAVHAQDAAVRLLLPRDAMQERPKLTPREVEALKWTMAGKTAWEVGQVLAISERTVVMHLQNAMHKLDVTTKHQAVIKALGFGLI